MAMLRRLGFKWVLRCYQKEAQIGQAGRLNNGLPLRLQLQWEDIKNAV